MAQLQAALQANLTSAIPKFYVNGIAMAMTSTDLIVTLLWNGAPTCNLNLSLSMSKGLSEDLSRAVADFEKLTGQTVQTVGQVGAAMQRARDEPNDAAPQGST